jgi:hypothetical protein
MALCSTNQSRAGQLWRLFAFLGRYGHQQLSELKKLPITDLMRFAKEVGFIISEESEVSRMGADQ